MIDPVKLINPRTFIEQHLRLIGKGYSGRKAFEMLNNSYEQEVGIKRYTVLRIYFSYCWGYLVNWDNSLVLRISAYKLDDCLGLANCYY